MNELTIGDELLSRKAAQCLELMRSDDRSLREQAVAELNSMPTEAIMDVLLATRLKDRVELEREMRLHHHPIFAVLIPLLPFLIGGLVAFLNAPLGIAIMIAGGGAVYLRGWAGLPRIRRNKLRGTVIHQLLNNSNNPRTAVIHAEIFRLPIDKWPDREPVASAVERLIQLLPQISPDYPESLDPRQKILMHTALIQVSRITSLTSRQALLTTAMMQYVANVGDLQAMQAVEAIAGIRSPAPIEQRMIEQAQITMGILQDLQHRIKLGETMLRPSEAPLVNDAVLLRAAKEADPSNQDAELLRAHNGELK